MRHLTRDVLTSLLDIARKRDGDGYCVAAFEGAAWKWFGPVCLALGEAWKQADLDRQAREASQVEFARLNRELNEARAEIARLRQFACPAFMCQYREKYDDERVSAFEGIGR